MKRFANNILLITAISVTLLVSCNKNKILEPNDQLTSEAVYSTAAGYKSVLAKVYGSFALTGNNGPAGSADIAGIDEGTSDFFRLFWCAQELSTDEAVVSWADAGLPDFHAMSWSASNTFLAGLYYRSTYQITLCNEFIRQCSDANISSRGITGDSATMVRYYKQEARLLRAYQYWVLMDLFGNAPFATEKDVLGSATPKQIDRASLYTYIMNELKDVEGSLVAPRQNEYGRADQAAAWALIARVALNAKVYTGTANWDDAVKYSKKVIDAGYSLINDYTHLMLADNHNNKSEFILTINYDGNATQNYGGSTFMTHAAVGGTEKASDFGIDGGWAGIRATANLIDLFPAPTSTAFPNNGNPDKRAQYWMNGQTKAIADISVFTNGYSITKYRNVDVNGVAGKNIYYADIDFPVFRLAEQYLIYAEATLRGGSGGDGSQALTYINKLRTRAYAGNSGNIAASEMTLNFLLDERARELYWEGFRRTDLVRYDRFTDGSYLWPWKGGSKNGTGVPAYRNLYPLPTADLNVNPNLKQNTGY
ncbi:MULTISPECIES: RagB/SusD family nutrient uptake outer membrane protein [Niastella]|uniref:RagB/SusD family nutrient uptake outer membrane protein n=1 Tax=Niastella soli TaxID=2821487 RepID=A0ABS3Z2B1_9BACT|nr:RagB/SusD family nutrient uptake outer membrane protein [Niastella soli]MBO9204275.1 RagB/SusD family nutrient uptake outer membrane protein [Niastella soli]